jgi:hypothetical protein
MEEKKEFRNIVAGIAFTVPAELKIAASGERLKDYEAEFNDHYFDGICSKIKHKKWGVQFAQIDLYNPKFVVDIFVDDKHEFATIYNLISSNPLKDITFEMMQPYYSFEKFLELTKQQTPE